MSTESWITGIVFVLALGLLTLTTAAPLYVLSGALTLLIALGVVDVKLAMAGLSNEGVVTIAVLFVVAAGVRETGAFNLIVDRILRRPRSLAGAQAQIMVPVAVMSAFMNNTPLVAMLMPAVADWARRLQLSVSKLMLPLSYASILGGACTLVGTSTNLVVNGWLISNLHPPLRMFEMAWLGVPLAILGLIYVVCVGRWLLPDRRPPISLGDDPREYTVEMLVEPGSPLAGKTIEQAGLRHLPGLFLMEIDRDEEVLAAPSSSQVLLQNDRLVFAGVVESIVDLHKTRGLKPATDQIYKIDEPLVNRRLVEAVVSHTCPLVGQTIREGKFRTHYKAAVIAVARNGERITGKLGDIRIRAGDTLLLEARGAFAAQQRNSRDFYLVSNIDDFTPVNHALAPLALAILAGMICAVTFLKTPMIVAAIVAAALMVVTRCCRGSTALAAVDLQVVLVIVAALGLGEAMNSSGLADALATPMGGLIGGNPYVGLATIFLATTLLASLVTAKAAVVIILPIASKVSAELGVDFMPFVMVALFAASTTLATPIGYPTNLMVMGPGGYRFRDYLVVGLPLTVLIGIVTLFLAPVIWPLQATR